MKYARIYDNIVIEVFIPPVGYQLNECFTAELVAQFELCPDEVEAQWVKQSDGSFLPPSPPLINNTTE